MPSTETRRYADLIVLIRETVGDAMESDDEITQENHVYHEIWGMANKQEKDAILEFCSWFIKKE